MLPTINFGFLICSYLPGVPLAIVVYFYLLLPKVDCVNNITEAYWTSYLVIVPLILGLLLDGFRHGSAWVASKSACLERLIWEDLPPDKMKSGAHGYEIEYFKTILDSSSTYYHVYEFFYNFGISSGIAVLIVHIYGKNTGADRLAFWIFVILTMVALVSSWVFRSEQSKKIKKWFP